jgi:D-glycero-alpha-D-manno-heptose-7-phosphate kinase
MIISRTPLRMSFVGGGSDMASYYKNHGGAVVSTSISKYIYLCGNKKFEPGYRLSYSEQENILNIDDIKHHLFRECLRYFDLKDFFEIASIADIPSSGSGLGSSSSFTVGLINLLSTFQGKTLTKEVIAEIACEIEIEKCGSPIGKQDQYAASVGGFNKFIFNKDGTTEVKKIECDLKHINKFDDWVIVFHTGGTRNANNILAAQNKKMASLEKQNVMREMVLLCDPLIDFLQRGDIASIGSILDHAWGLKKSILDSISNPDIDKYYNKAKKAGALGGKLLGAGQHGFLMFCAPPCQHEKITNTLCELQKIDVNFEDKGTFNIKC